MLSRNLTTRLAEKNFYSNSWIDNKVSIIMFLIIKKLPLNKNKGLMAFKSIFLKNIVEKSSKLSFLGSLVDHFRGKRQVHIREHNTTS